MQVFQSSEMQIIHAFQTDHIQHLKSASTLMWSPGCLVPVALSWPSKEGERADGVIQLSLAEKQIEKGKDGNEKAAALGGSCSADTGCSDYPRWH